MGIKIKVFIINNGRAVRVTIPKMVWLALGAPKEFDLTIENDRIVLTPRPVSK